MQLKFYLNKFLKVDNIEQYTLGALKELENTYEDFKQKTDGIDPDFPSITFKTKGNNLIVGSNVYDLLDTTPDPNGPIKTQPSIYRVPPSDKQKRE
jgi:hypothetical protein